MNRRHEVYLFGQILGTHSFLLQDGFLKPDEYAEIKDLYFLPGGETGTAATVLDSMGVSVKMDGTWIGTEVAPMLKSFYADKQVDLSSITFTDEPGVMDYVVIAGLVRSPMGRFRTLFGNGRRWWGIPKEDDYAFAYIGRHTGDFLYRYKSEGWGHMLNKVVGRYSGLRKRK